MSNLKALSGLFKGRSKRLEVVGLIGVDTDNPAAVGEVAAEVSAVEAVPASAPGKPESVAPAPAVIPPPVVPASPPSQPPAPAVTEKTAVPRAFRRR